MPLIQINNQVLGGLADSKYRRNKNGQFVKGDPALILRNKSEKQKKAVSEARKKDLAEKGFIFTKESQEKSALARKRLGIGFKKGNTFGKIHKGKKASIELRNKLSKAHIGLQAKEKHHNWKGGITPKHELIRKSKKYLLWKIAIFKRDNYTCIECGARRKKGERVIINADHIKPFALFPKLRFSMSNGRTLCLDCHKKTDSYGAKSNKLNFIYANNTD